MLLKRIHSAPNGQCEASTYIKKIVTFVAKLRNSGSKEQYCDAATICRVVLAVDHRDLCIAFKKGNLKPASDTKTILPAIAAALGDVHLLSNNVVSSEDLFRPPCNLFLAHCRLLLLSISLDL